MRSTQRRGTGSRAQAGEFNVRSRVPAWDGHPSTQGRSTRTLALNYCDRSYQAVHTHAEILARTSEGGGVARDDSHGRPTLPGCMRWANDENVLLGAKSGSDPWPQRLGCYSSVAARGLTPPRYGRRFSWAATALETTISPSPSERRRSASERAATCASQGAGRLPDMPMAPGVSSGGLAQAASPRAMAAGQNDRASRRGRGSLGCSGGRCGDMWPRISPDSDAQIRRKHAKVNRVLPIPRGRIAAGGRRRRGSGANPGDWRNPGERGPGAEAMNAE